MESCDDDRRRNDSGKAGAAGDFGKAVRDSASRRESGAEGDAARDADAIARTRCCEVRHQYGPLEQEVTVFGEDRTLELGHGQTWRRYRSSSASRIAGHGAAPARARTHESLRRF